MTKDERELAGVGREIEKLRLNIDLVHFLGRTVDGHVSTVEGKYDYTNAIVFDPICCTMPFSGKLLPQVVEEYKVANRNRFEQKMSKYRGASFIGLRAHVLGLERHVMCMAAPHNAVAVVFRDARIYSEEAIWNTIMAAGLVRNTFLYHRRTFDYFVTQISALNVAAKRINEAEHPIMPWENMRRPPYCAFTKEQRRRAINVIRESSMFGNLPDDITDFALAELVEKAQQDPKLLKKMLDRRADPDSGDEDPRVVKGSMSRPLQRMQDVKGEPMDQDDANDMEQPYGDADQHESSSSSVDSEEERQIQEIKRKAADRKRKKKVKGDD
jgi:hypothetical protein